MGVVYRGHDPVIDRPVALKTVLLPETLSPSERKTYLERFFLEARIAGSLIHPNIVVTYDASTDEATQIPFIVMELVEGEPLSLLLERQHRLPWKDALDIVVPLAGALGYAHQNDVVHRDIKPANILLTKNREPKIADFGIAKLAASQLTQAGVVMGTPYFMSPEQLLGEQLDGRSDLFSLGGLLYILITGQLPFQGSELAVIASMVLHKDPIPPSESAPGIPSDLDGVIARALAKPVDQRYATARELEEDLHLVRRGARPCGATSPGEKTRAQPAASVEPSQPQPERLKQNGLELNKRLKYLGGKLWTFAKWRKRWVTALFLLCVGCGTLFFRHDIEQLVLFYQAKWAADNGDFLRSESKLEMLLEKDSEDEGTSDLLLEVSLELLKPHLPLTFAARHDHRIGNCTGSLALHDWGVEYISRKHGEWRWQFDQMLDMWRDNKWGFSLETNEDDMLGLLASKRYNFTLMNEPLEEEWWKRYRRLLR